MRVFPNQHSYRPKFKFHNLTSRALWNSYFKIVVGATPSLNFFTDKFIFSFLMVFNVTFSHSYLKNSYIEPGLPTDCWELVVAVSIYNELTRFRIRCSFTNVRRPYFNIITHSFKTSIVKLKGNAPSLIKGVSATFGG